MSSGRGQREALVSTTVCPGGRMQGKEGDMEGRKET